MRDYLEEMRSFCDIGNCIHPGFCFLFTEMSGKDEEKGGAMSIFIL